MISVNNISYILHKAINIEIAYKLSSEEFKCKCTRKECHITLFNPRLKDSWNLSRSQFGRPLRINSGYRCQAHNADVGGAKESTHTLGQALDISHAEFKPLEKMHLLSILESNFDKVIEYPSFYHCHNN